MSLHRLEYEYYKPEWGVLELEMDDDLEVVEKEEIAIREIKEIEGEDVRDISINAIIFG